jgi:hypothetical protein
MSNHTISVTTTGSLLPFLRRSGILFFGGLAIGSAQRFFEGGSQQGTALLWMVVASGVGGTLWAGLQREHRRNNGN